jgi:hypothetical protein
MIAPTNKPYPHQNRDHQWQGAFEQGKKLFEGAVDFSNDRQTQTAIAASLIQSSRASKGAQIRLEVERTAIATSKALQLSV